MLLANSKLSIVRAEGEVVGVKIYNISDKFSENGFSNGDLITEVCDEKISQALSFSSCCGYDEYKFLVKSGEKGEVVVSLPRE